MSTGKSKPGMGTVRRADLRVLVSQDLASEEEVSPGRRGLDHTQHDRIGAIYSVDDEVIAPRERSNTCTQIVPTPAGTRMSSQEKGVVGRRAVC
jgi:hypothetical protein